jgi:hypothetical protein
MGCTPGALQAAAIVNNNEKYNARAGAGVAE